MGYTHYWENVPSGFLPKEAIKHIETLLAHYAPLIQIEFDDPQNPIATDELIHFNGKGENGHETFFFTPEPSFQFCKTARKPYDIVVCEVLLILKHFIPEMKLSSDGFDHSLMPEYQTGEHEGTWPEAIANVSKRLHTDLNVTKEWCESRSS